MSIGATLEQYFGQGLQPVAYENRKLILVEARYSAYERELLVVVCAIGKWKHSLERRRFIVQTDHSSLRHLPNLVYNLAAFNLSSAFSDVLNMILQCLGDYEDVI